MQNYIESKLANGSYENASAMIREAVRRMQSEEARLLAWKIVIAKGERQLDRSEGIPYTPALMEAIAQKAIVSMHTGVSIRPDVLP